MSSLSDSEIIQQQIRVEISRLTQLGIWPPEDGVTVSLRVPIDDGGGSSSASKVAIEALPVVMITAAEEQEQGEEEECSICLNEYLIGEEAKVMPCRHRFHSGCLDKWLGIHGSCPICRFKIPAGRRQLVMEFVYRHRRRPPVPN